MANDEPGRLQPEEYDAYPSSPAASPAAKSPSKKSPKYSGERLKKIGEDCKDRLPPASAMQSMFLYEHKRHAENEKLFQSALFQLAEQESHAAAEKNSMKDVEKRLAKLEKQAVHDRVNTSSLMVKVHGDKLTACTRRVDTVDEKLVAIDAQLEKLKMEAAEAATAQATHNAEMEKPSTPEPNPVIITIQQEVDVLFVDRDNILAMVGEAKTRLTKLEENLRALTLQRAAPARSPATLPHRLPIMSPNGSQIDLSVPKGMAHVGLKKENAAPRSASPGLKKENGAARSFVPAEQWG